MYIGASFAHERYYENKAMVGRTFWNARNKEKKDELQKQEEENGEAM